MYMGGIEAQNVGFSTRDYILDIGPTDVLLGRGAPFINNAGNVAFRQLVSTRKTEYLSTNIYQIKDRIAREIAQEIQNRNGRFLRKIESDEERRELGVPPKVTAWKLADEASYIEKIKQTLRGKSPPPKAKKDRSVGQRQSLKSRKKAPPPQPRSQDGKKGESLAMGAAPLPSFLSNGVNGIVTATQQIGQMSTNDLLQQWMLQQNQYHRQQQQQEIAILLKNRMAVPHDPSPSTTTLHSQEALLGQQSHVPRSYAPNLPRKHEYQANQSESTGTLMMPDPIEILRRNTLLRSTANPQQQHIAETALQTSLPTQNQQSWYQLLLDQLRVQQLSSNSMNNPSAQLSSMQLPSFHLQGALEHGDRILGVDVFAAHRSTEDSNAFNTAYPAAAAPHSPKTGDYDDSLSTNLKGDWWERKPSPRNDG